MIRRDHGVVTRRYKLGDDGRKIVGMAMDAARDGDSGQRCGWIDAVRDAIVVDAWRGRRGGGR